jgi:hypothetical protein
VGQFALYVIVGIRRWGFPSDVEATRHPTLGVFLNVPVGSLFIAPTVNFVRYKREEGVRVYDPVLMETATVSDASSYLSIQADLQIPFTIGTARFYAVAAPRLNILVESDRFVEPYYYGSHSSDEFHIPAHNSTVWGGAVGIGQNIDVGRHTLILEIRYDRDFEAAWTLPREGSLGPQDQHVFHRTVMIQLGLQLWTNKVKPPTEELPAGPWLPTNAPLPR